MADLAGKEYSKADSRYVARDPTVVIIEGITAVLAGPGCLLAVYALLSTWFAITYTVCLSTQRVLFAFLFFHFFHSTCNVSTSACYLLKLAGERGVHVTYC